MLQQVQARTRAEDEEVLQNNGNEFRHWGWIMTKTWKHVLGTFVDLVNKAAGSYLDALAHSISLRKIAKESVMIMGDLAKQEWAVWAPRTDANYQAANDCVVGTCKGFFGSTSAALDTDKR